MKKPAATTLLCAALGAFSFHAAAASPATEETMRDNLRDFDFVVATISANYSGFADKTAGRRAELDELTTRLRTQVADADTFGCADIIRRWLAFLNDRHLGFALLVAPKAFPSQPTRDLDEQKATAYFSSAKALDPIEGIWDSADRAYRLAIVAGQNQPGRFEAIVLQSQRDSWSPGQVKAELQRSDAGGYEGKFFMRDHSPRSVYPQLLEGGDLLHFDGAGGGYFRVGSLKQYDPAHFDRYLPAPDFFLRKLSDNTLWLRLPHFQHEQADKLKRLIEDNRTLLAETPNLVIDLRSNGGGSDVTYAPILPWLYTRPIYKIGVEIYSTEENIRKFTDLLKDPHFPEEDRPRYVKLIEAMRANPGRFVRHEDDVPRDFYVRTFSEVTKNPRNVGIIISNASSSGEQFVLAARQSWKVTLFGRKTSGKLDYANLRIVHTPTGRFGIGYPTSRSLRLPLDPVDPTGILPDVPFDDTAPDVDPIAYVQAWLERQQR